jgi:uncharacterized membrane protein YoaK (UPF0700 family)
MYVAGAISSDGGTMSPATDVATRGDQVGADPPSSALALAVAAGAVDGLGYVLLDGLFTAHITGNTVKAGTALGRLGLSTALVDGFPILVFVLGVVAGALLRDLLARWVSRPRVIVLATSATLLAGFVVAGALLEMGRAPPRGALAFYVLAALATASMGIQNAAKPSIAGRPVRTFITGTMVDFGEALAAALAAGAARAEPLRRAAVLFAVWLTYLVGAAAGGAAALHVGTFAAAVPGCCVVAALALERRHSP